jgi:endonuclease-3 related protein
MILRDATTPELMDLYDRLLAHFGPRGWWPADSPVEMMVGALLTQSVAWRNVKTCLARLKEAELLDWRALHEAPDERIEELIRPSRFFKAKTRKLKALAAYLIERHGGDLSAMFAQPMEMLRKELLAVHGLGPETVDCILLYAGDHPSFVVDAYTRRIFSRLGYFDERIGYEPMRAYFSARLPADVPLYNEYHALIDGLGHHFCHPKDPGCDSCPLQARCSFSEARPTAGSPAP